MIVMCNFFNDDVPRDYQQDMGDRLRIHFEKKDVEQLRHDLYYYEIFCPFDVQARINDVRYSVVIDIAKVEKLFKDYGLI